MNFFQIMANALGGFDNVAEALAGEAVGKKQMNLFKKVIIDVRQNHELMIYNL